MPLVSGIVSELPTGNPMRTEQTPQHDLLIDESFSLHTLPVSSPALIPVRVFS